MEKCDKSTTQLGESLKVLLEVELAFVLVLVHWLLFLYVTTVLLLVMVVLLSICREATRSFCADF